MRTGPEKVNLLSYKVLTLGMKNTIIILSVALMLLTVGCKPQVDTGNGLVSMPDVSREDAEKMLEENIQLANEFKAKLKGQPLLHPLKCLPHLKFSSLSRASLWLMVKTWWRLNR